MALQIHYLEMKAELDHCTDKLQNAIARECTELEVRTIPAAVCDHLNVIMKSDVSCRVKRSLGPYLTMWLTLISTTPTAPPVAKADKSERIAEWPVASTILKTNLSTALAMYQQAWIVEYASVPMFETVKCMDKDADSEEESSDSEDDE